GSPNARRCRARRARLAPSRCAPVQAQPLGRSADRRESGEGRRGTPRPAPPGAAGGPRESFGSARAGRCRGPENRRASCPRLHGLAGRGPRLRSGPHPQSGARAQADTRRWCTRSRGPVHRKLTPAQPAPRRFPSRLRPSNARYISLALRSCPGLRGNSGPAAIRPSNARYISFDQCMPAPRAGLVNNTRMATPASEWRQPQRGARAVIVFAVGLLAALALAWWLRELVLLIYASVLFAIVIDPLVAGVQDGGGGERHLGHGAALAVVLAGAAVGGALLLAILVPPLVREATALIVAWPTVSSQSLAAVQRLATGVADGCTILLLTVYLVAEGRETRDWCLGMIAPGPRRRLALTLDRGQRRMRGWLLAQSALALCMGVASLTAFAALRLPDFYALALLAALLSFVPVLGPLTAAAVAGAVAGVQSWFALGGVLMFFAVYEGFENAYLVPKVMRNAVDLPGLAIILALAVGAALGGVLGAVLAVPTAALVAELLGEYARQPEEE